jgi:hypothetical protein
VCDATRTEREGGTYTQKSERARDQLLLYIYITSGRTNNEILVCRTLQRCAERKKLVTKAQAGKQADQEVTCDFLLVIER